WMTSGTRTGTACTRCSAIPTSRTPSGRTISDSTSTRAVIPKRGEASPSTSTATTTTAPSPVPTWGRASCRPPRALGPRPEPWGPGRIDVFVRGTDQAVWHKWLTGGVWSKWESLGGVVTAGTGPSAASWGASRLEIFVQGTDKAVWEKTWNGATWSRWTSIGG